VWFLRNQRNPPSGAKGHEDGCAAKRRANGTGVTAGSFAGAAVPKPRCSRSVATLVCPGQAGEDIRPSVGWQWVVETSGNPEGSRARERCQAAVKRTWGAGLAFNATNLRTVTKFVPSTVWQV
jgi:hypothetical protein